MVFWKACTGDQPAISFPNQEPGNRKQLVAHLHSLFDAACIGAEGPVGLQQIVFEISRYSLGLPLVLEA